jgi:hypothetical protein
MHPQFFLGQEIPPLILEIILWLLGQEYGMPNILLRGYDRTFLAELRAHRLAPAIGAQIMRQGLEGAFSPQLLGFLKHDYYVALQNSLRQEEEAIQVMQALAAAGIDLIILKGADLRHRLYDEPALRPMTDLDLLIAREAVPPARATLIRLGYTLAAESLGPRPGFREKFRAALHFKAPPGGTLLVDLHWHLEAVANFYRLPYGALSQEAIPWKYAEVPVKVLSPEHLLIHLCLHNYDEFLHGLQIVDLGLALTQLPLNWCRFLEEVALFNCQAPIYLMLEQLGRLIPLAVPRAVLAPLGQYRPSLLERAALSHRLNKVIRLLAPLYHHRRLGDWTFYLGALLWPDANYLTAVCGKPDRPAFLRQSLRDLLGFGSSYNQERRYS